MRLTRGNRPMARITWFLAAILTSVLVAHTTIDGAGSQDQTTLMTKGKLAADLGNYAAAIEAFSSVANDGSLSPALRGEAFVRLGLARSGAGDMPGSLSALKTVITRYSAHREAVRWATGAIAVSIPGKVWPEFKTEIEELLRTAEIVSTTDMGMAKTAPKQLRLKWDEVEPRAVWRSSAAGQGLASAGYSRELAAYEVDKLLGLDMVPPTVARSIDDQPGAIQFWVNGVRVYKRVEEMPQTREWGQQMSRMKLYDNLIGNTGRVLSNMLVDQNENLMLVDHVFGFSGDRTLKDPPAQFDRRLVEKLRSLETPDAWRRLKDILGDSEIEGLRARRDALVRHLEKLIAERGEAAVVF